MKFIVETSARHIHLTQEALEKLCGEGYQLTVKKELSQPGQFASNTKLDLVGPKNTIHGVSILGPVRKENQVEVSATDARTLGVKAPVRESGDVKGSAPIKIVNPANGNELDLEDEINDFLNEKKPIILSMHYQVAMTFSNELEYSFSCLIVYEDS